MRHSRRLAGLSLMALVAFAAGFAAKQPHEIKRVGMVVGIDPQRIGEYKQLHADNNPGVRDLLNK